MPRLFIAAIVYKRWGEGRKIASVGRAARMVWQHYLNVLLGVVLVLDGVLKGQQLLADPSVGRATGFPRELLIGASTFELAFGCWLLAGLYRQLTRWLALLWFTILAAVSLAQAVGGVPSCACFGELHTHPWLLFSFDVAAVIALWLWSPDKDAPSRRRLLAVLCLSVLAAASLSGLAGASRTHTIFAEIDLGDLVQGGRKEHAFQCRNDSGASVEVAAIETSCPCASIHLKQTAVRVDQLLTGNVSVDLGSRPGFVGDLTIEAKGLTRSGQVAIVLVIRARVHPASQADKDSL